MKNGLLWQGMTLCYVYMLHMDTCVGKNTIVMFLKFDSNIDSKIVAVFSKKNCCSFQFQESPEKHQLKHHLL